MAPPQKTTRRGNSSGSVICAEPKSTCAGQDHYYAAQIFGFGETPGRNAWIFTWFATWNGDNHEEVQFIRTFIWKTSRGERPEDRDERTE
jgi:hypothetical protein